MRDILSDLEESLAEADIDPINRAREQMRRPQPKRFYTAVSVEEGEGGFAVALDGRQVRTPMRNPVRLASRRLADALAGEFDAQEKTIDAGAMPLYRLINTAIDAVSGQEQAVMEDIQRFASTDLLCYRADGPERLCARQTELWDPVIDWARAALGARFVLAEGIMHVEQPRESIAAIGVHLQAFADPLKLAALHAATTLGGSALLALAVAKGEMTADEAWQAAHVDEDWNIELWGEDAEAVARRAFRKREFDAAALVLTDQD